MTLNKNDIAQLCFAVAAAGAVIGAVHLASKAAKQGAEKKNDNKFKGQSLKLTVTKIAAESDHAKATVPVVTKPMAESLTRMATKGTLKALYVEAVSEAGYTYKIALDATKQKDTDLLVNIQKGGTYAVTDQGSAFAVETLNEGPYAAKHKSKLVLRR